MAEFLNKNLKYLRIQRNISQQALADKIGIDRSTISRIENNEIETTIDNAIKIADILNVSVNDLINKDLTNEKINKNFDELEILFDKHKEVLSESDKAIIKTIIEQRIKEIDKELGE